MEIKNKKISSFGIITLAILVVSFLFTSIVVGNKRYDDNLNNLIIQEMVEDPSQYSEAYINYLKGGQKSLGIIPNKYEVPFEEFKLDDRKTVSADMSSINSYNLANDIEIKVEDQNPFGTCYAFATCSALETTLAKTRNEYYDFSEMYLVSSEIIGREGYIGANYALNGSNINNLAQYAFQYGLVTEDAMPYKNYSYANYGLTKSGTIGVPDSLNISQSLADTLLGLDPVIKVSNFINYPTIVGNNKSFSYSYLSSFRNVVKEHIYNTGALYATMNFDTDPLSGYFNSTSNAYYQNVSNFDYGHGITIVGWDDNYSLNNFDTRPSANGAYLCLNSWGTSWGNNGYFWVSYEDYYIENSLCGFNVNSITSEKFAVSDSVMNTYFTISNDVRYFKQAFDRGENAPYINIKEIASYVYQNNVKVTISIAQSDISINNAINSTYTIVADSVNKNWCENRYSIELDNNYLLNSRYVALKIEYDEGPSIRLLEETRAYYNRINSSNPVSTGNDQILEDYSFYYSTDDLNYSIFEYNNAYYIYPIELFGTNLGLQSNPISDGIPATTLGTIKYKGISNVFKSGVESTLYYPVNVESITQTSGVDNELQVVIKKQTELLQTTLIENTHYKVKKETPTLEGYYYGKINQEYFDRIYLVLDSELTAGMYSVSITYGTNKIHSSFVIENSLYVTNKTLRDITYNVGSYGINSTLNPNKYYTGWTFNLSDPISENDENVFEGWYDNIACTGTAITTLSNTSDSDLQYYAKWQDNSLVVELDTYNISKEYDGNSIVITASYSVNSLTPTAINYKWYKKVGEDDPIELEETNNQLTISGKVQDSAIYYVEIEVSDGATTLSNNSNNCIVNISKRAITISKVSESSYSKAYDRSTSAYLVLSTHYNYSGILSADFAFVRINCVAIFENYNAGINKTINAVFTLASGGDNYQLSNSNLVWSNGQIEKKPIMIEGIQANNKEFDNTKNIEVSTLNAVASTGILSGDSVNVIQSTGNVLQARLHSSESVNASAIAKTVDLSLCSISITNQNYSAILPSNLTVIIRPTSNYSITTNPLASNITYGESLGNSVFSGGVAQINGYNINGVFTWVDNSIKPNAGSSKYNVKFTPSDANINSDAIKTASVDLEINKKSITISANKSDNITKMFDGTNTCDYIFLNTDYIIEGVIDSDEITLRINSKNFLVVTAGITKVAVQFAIDNDNYKFSNNSNSITINYDAKIDPITSTQLSEIVSICKEEASNNITDAIINMPAVFNSLGAFSFVDEDAGATVGTTYSLRFTPFSTYRSCFVCDDGQNYITITEILQAEAVRITLTSWGLNSRAYNGNSEDGSISLSIGTTTGILPMDSAKVWLEFTTTPSIDDSWKSQNEFKYNLPSGNVTAGAIFYDEIYIRVGKDASVETNYILNNANEDGYFVLSGRVQITEYLVNESALILKKYVGSGVMEDDLSYENINNTDYFINIDDKDSNGVDFTFDGTNQQNKVFVGFIGGGNSINPLNCNLSIYDGLSWTSVTEFKNSALYRFTFVTNDDLYRTNYIFRVSSSFNKQASIGKWKLNILNLNCNDSTYNNSKLIDTNNILIGDTTDTLFGLTTEELSEIIVTSEGTTLVSLRDTFGISLDNNVNGSKIVASVENSNVGNNKALEFSGFVLSGENANNFEIEVTGYTINIIKKSVSFTYVNTTLTYNKNNQKPDVIINGLCVGDYCNVITQTNPQNCVNAGTYTIFVTSISNNNYTYSSDEPTISSEFKIAKLKIVIKALDSLSLKDRNLSDLKYTIIEGGYYEGDELNISLSTDADNLNVGEYFVYVVADNDNYDIEVIEGKYSVLPTFDTDVFKYVFGGAGILLLLEMFIVVIKIALFKSMKVYKTKKLTKKALEMVKLEDVQQYSIENKTTFDNDIYKQINNDSGNPDNSDKINENPDTND